MNLEDQISALIQALDTKASTLGLHLKMASTSGYLTQEYSAKIAEQIQSSGNEEEIMMNLLDGKNLVEDVKGNRAVLTIAVTFATADLAWDDRTLYPERFVVDTEAAVLLPTSAEMLAEEVHRQLTSGVKPEDVVIPEEYK